MVAIISFAVIRHIETQFSWDIKGKADVCKAIIIQAIAVFELQLILFWGRI